MPIQANSEFEVNILQQFRKQVADLRQDDVTLLRFLIAREFDVEKAGQMLRNCIEWRMKNNLNSLLKWDVPQYLRKDLPYRITGNDFCGGPIIWIPFGRYSHRQWVEANKGDEILRYANYVIEDALCCMQRNGGREQISVIFGLENLSFYQAAHLESLRLLYAAFQVLETNFPEILKRLIVVNSPILFSIPFNFIKGILSAHTLSKLKVFDSNKTVWMTYLLEIAPKSSLPKEYFEEK